MQTTYSRRTLQQSNFLCKLSENIFPTTSSAGHFIAEAPGCIGCKIAHDYETIRREMGERERTSRFVGSESERAGFGCTFPSCCTTLGWFQVLNCYFNTTTSHVSHHLHHTPSTHPARLSVDSRRRAFMGHLWNMCRGSVPERNIADIKSET